ncbi:MAG: hypothetical protein ACK5ZY_04860 [Cyclobacteriaceae bacterium]|jgi:hypothetical protein
MKETRTKFPLLDFAAFPVEKLLELGWNGYFKTQLTPEKVKERKDSIVSEVISIKGFITKEEVAFIENRLSQSAAEDDHKRYIRIFNS